MEKPAPAKRAKQKRNRIITACYDCRERKAGCDRKKPICTRCQDGSGRTCIYLDPPNNALINGVSRSVTSLPKDTREKVTNLYNQCLGDNRHEDDEANADYEGLEPSPLVQDSASYDNEHYDADTELLDVGFRVGKVQLTTRVGGNYRPVMVEELKNILDETAQQPEWAEEQAMWPAPPDTYETGMVTPNTSFLRPSTTYFAPNLNFGSISDFDVNLMQYLPSFSVSAVLLEQYWLAVHSIARVLHRPTFEQRWRAFASDLSMHNRPGKSLQALIFAVLFSGIASMPPGVLERDFGLDQQLWTRNLKTGAESALSDAHMFSSTNIETLQAFVAYLIVICRGEVSRSHATLVAAAIRVAELNGLHVDGRNRGYNAIQTHVRRLIWFNLGILDIRVTEAQGPRPLIRAEDFTTQFPANVNDADLTEGHHPESKGDQWTEMTVPLIRFRCNEFMRSIWIARKQIMDKEHTLAPVIKQIETFRLEWSLKFSPSNPDDPIQRFGVRVIELQLCRCAVMVMHPFHKHPKIEMPARLVSILCDNATRATEKSIELETNEDFAPWRWITGAMHQYHSALLLAVELLINPRRKEAARMWRSLNYVFEPPPLPPIARARWVTTQYWLRLDVYLSKRSLRPPVALETVLKEALHISESQKAESGIVTQQQSLQQLPPPSLPPTRSKPSHSQGNTRRGYASRPTNAMSSVMMSSPNSDSTLTDPSSSVTPPQHQGSPAWPTGNTNLSPPHTTLSPAPPNSDGRQLIDIDWTLLDTFYPQETHTGDLDVPFDRWTQLLQTVPFPTGTHQDNIALTNNNLNTSASIGSNNGYVPPAPTGGIDGLFASSAPSVQGMGMWNTTSQPGTSNPVLGTRGGNGTSGDDAEESIAALIQQAQGGQGQGQHVAGQQQGQQGQSAGVPVPDNRRYNFGMGIYQPLPRH